MAELDRVGNSDNIKFRRDTSFLQVCEKRSQATRKRKKMRFCIKMVLLHISMVLGVTLPVCPVNKSKTLIRIKL